MLDTLNTIILTQTKSIGDNYNKMYEDMHLFPEDEEDWVELGKTLAKYNDVLHENEMKILKIKEIIKILEKYSFYLAIYILLNTT